LLASGESSLLCISPEKLEFVENGKNAWNVWVDQPDGTPLNLRNMPSHVNVKTSLAEFERLLVDTVSTPAVASRWLVAMHEGLLPLVRGLLSARMILLHIGPSQCGKTSAAQRFTLLHGLRAVKGDYSVAALRNMRDPGIIVLDNKEQADLTRDLFNFLLYLATGAEHGRSDLDGNVRTTSLDRPVAVITTIEGVVREELRRRCAEVLFERQRRFLSRTSIEAAIVRQRSQFMWALAHVVQRFLQNGGAGPHSREFDFEFGEYAETLGNLLKAYAEVSGRPATWAQDIVAEWRQSFLPPPSEEGCELEYLMRKAIRSGQLFGSPRPCKLQGRQGLLMITQIEEVLDALSRVTPRDYSLPRTPTGLMRRLRSTALRSVQIIEACPHAPVSELRKRHGNGRVGIFCAAEHEEEEILLVSGQDLNTQPLFEFKPINSDDLCHHSYLRKDDECYYLSVYEAGSRRRFGIPGTKLSSVNRLIRDLQQGPLQRLSEEAKAKKGAAIHLAAEALSAIPADIRSMTIVPLPPSSPRSHPSYDDRLTAILASASPLFPDVREMLVETVQRRGKTKQLSPADRALTLAVCSALCSPKPSRIAVFDDVITSGSHFKAAQIIFQRQFPDIKIIGLFLARAIQWDPL
jgi:hypothetical protein